MNSPNEDCMVCKTCTICFKSRRRTSRPRHLVYGSNPRLLGSQCHVCLYPLIASPHHFCAPKVAVYVYKMNAYIYIANHKQISCLDFKSSFLAVFCCFTVTCVKASLNLSIDYMSHTMVTPDVWWQHHQSMLTPTEPPSISSSNHPLAVKSDELLGGSSHFITG